MLIRSTGEAIAGWFNPEYAKLTDAGIIVPPTVVSYSLFSLFPAPELNRLGLDFDFALSLAFGYLLVVFFGSMMMKKICGGIEPETPKNLTFFEKISREPILAVATVYNAFQSLLCFYMMCGSLTVAYTKGYRVIGNTHNLRDPSLAPWTHIFYLSKVLDFFDTAIIISRRKWRQLSFLHVYHHFSIFLIYHFIAKAGFDGDIYFTVALNSFIHLMMYSYYFLRTFNVKVPVFWKKFVTSSQLLQFIGMMFQGIVLLVLPRIGFTGGYPERLTMLYVPYIFSLYLLFQVFFKKNYGGKGLKKDERSIIAGANEGAGLDEKDDKTKLKGE